MNGDPNAHISEHAFGNALDVAEFTLADGHKVSVQYGWHGTPEEQAFLHDVQSAACEQFTTVLAPGANVYHYNHIHVDLMRHYNSRHICEPSAISGQVAFERARSQYAAKHGDPGITGALGKQDQAHSRLFRRGSTSGRTRCPATTDQTGISGLPCFRIEFCRRAVRQFLPAASICCSTAAVGQQSTFMPLRF